METIVFKKANWKWLRWFIENYRDSLASHECWYCHSCPVGRYGFYQRMDARWCAFVDEFWRPLLGSLICSWRGHRKLPRKVLDGTIVIDCCTRCNDATD